MSRQITFKSFEELSKNELYSILHARSQEFGMYMGAGSHDVDGRDPVATHALISRDDDVLGYCRVLPPNLKKPTEQPDDIKTKKSKKSKKSKKLPKKYVITMKDLYVSIDKVVILTPHRGYGLARFLIGQTLAYCAKKYPKQLIFIQSPVDLIGFYQSMKFQVASEPYTIDKIKYVDMIYGSKKAIKIKKTKKPPPKRDPKKPTAAGKMFGLLLALLTFMIFITAFYIFYSN